MSADRHRRSVGVALLVVSLILAHLPIPTTAASVPAALVCSSTATSACSEAEALAPDDCCAPAPVVQALDPCCAPTAEAENPGEGGEPCCPSGCKHCPRPCCSAPLALISDVGKLTIEFSATARAELPLPDYTSAAPAGVFHPPRA
jgi:hypothetical protein